MTSPSNKFPPTHFCLSFGRSKEWYFWFLRAADSSSDNFRNFSDAAKAMENCVLDDPPKWCDVSLLEAIVERLIQSNQYLPISFPAICIYLDLTESWEPTIHLEYYTSFPVISDDIKIETDFLLLYSRNEYWDDFQVALFKATPNLREAIQDSYARELNAKPNISPLDLHTLIVSQLTVAGFEQVDFDIGSLCNPTWNGEGLTPSFWEKYVSKEFLDLHQENTDPNVGTGTDVWPF